MAVNVSSSVQKESMVIRSQDMGGKLCRPFQALHRDRDGQASNSLLTQHRGRDTWVLRLVHSKPGT